MKVLLMFVLQVTSVLGQDLCSFPQIPKGSCKPLKDCKFLLKLIHEVTLPEIVETYGGCGRNKDGDTMLCCPELSSSPIPSQNRCDFPHALEGSCRNQDECLLLRAMAEQLTVTDFQNTYGGCGRNKDGDEMLCCPQSSSSSSSSSSGILLPEVPSTQLTTGESCKSPSLYIEDLGCITGIGQGLAWEDARSRCQSSGQRLLEGVKEEHLPILKQHFGQMGYQDTWIGFRDLKWASSGEDLPGRGVSPSLWEIGHPQSSEDRICGAIRLGPQTHGLFSFDCSFTWNGLCQRTKTF